MKFRQFLDACLKGDEAVLGKLGGLAKKKPAGNPDDASKTPAADIAGAEDKPVEKLPTEDKKDDVSLAEKPPKEDAATLNKKEEDEDDIIMVKAKKKEENDEAEDKKGMKESFFFLNSLKSLNTIQSCVETVVEDSEDMKFDRNKTQQESEKIANLIKNQFNVSVDMDHNNNGSITIVCNDGSVVSSSDTNPHIFSAKNLSNFIDKSFRDFRSNGWTFTQPTGGKFTIGVPELVEDATNFHQQGAAVHPPHEMMNAIDEIDKVSKENFARYHSGGNKLRDIAKVFTDLWNKEVIKGGETPSDVNWEDVCDTLETNFFSKFKNNQGENKQQWESDPVFEKWMEEIRAIVEKFQHSLQ